MQGACVLAIYTGRAGGRQRLVLVLLVADNGGLALCSGCGGRQEAFATGRTGSGDCAVMKRSDSRTASAKRSDGRLSDNKRLG